MQNVLVSQLISCKTTKGADRDSGQLEQRADGKEFREFALQHSAAVMVILYQKDLDDIAKFSHGKLNMSWQSEDRDAVLSLLTELLVINELVRRPCDPSTQPDHDRIMTRLELFVGLGIVCNGGCLGYVFTI